MGVSNSEIQDLGTALQKECHEVGKDIIERTGVSPQAATNVWIYHKLAEYELRLRKLESERV